ncbi:N-acetyltransferase [Desulfovibrio legallii]|uniref:N-acetylglutamate synthase n=1 Tax=Desulfovibrio legallii TaxID=571438 RepID=A0A1G7MXI0_9BACT|nr:N-acetyltransferase [Desulfovibrio legallii]SDF66545.1 N-acetylglutamate synthase [Desulfovibrio legallii]
MSMFTVRKARMDDVPAMHGLLLDSARQGLLLPRALIHLYGHVRNFMVACEATGRIVGCCALAPVWEDLAEICSLVVRDDLRRQGVGRLLVAACLEDCAPLSIRKVFALTYQEVFFARLGFAVVDKSVLPQKIWADCVHCAKYPDCDESAVFLDLTATQAGPQGGKHV